MVKEWHPELNGDLKPTEVVVGSKRKIWWFCQYGHPPYAAQPKHRTHKSNPTGCPYCSGNKLTPERSLKVRSPKVAEEWHPEKNGELTPLDVAWQSNKKIWWLCSMNPEHEWPARVADRTRKKNPSGCRYCAKIKDLQI